MTCVCVCVSESESGEVCWGREEVGMGQTLD